MPERIKLYDVVDYKLFSQEVRDGYIRVRSHPEASLQIASYSERTQYENHWNAATLLARGLIVDRDFLDRDARIVARPFSKFFNLGDVANVGSTVFESKSFRTFEKLDGSLGVAYRSGDGWAVATRGSFDSEQAQFATKLLNERYGGLDVADNVTVCFEIIAPWNRIVVDYADREDLVLIGALDNTSGADVEVGSWRGPRAREFSFDSLDDLISHVASSEGRNEEGFVVVFDAPNGAASLRVKAKYTEYLRLHRMATGLSNIVVYDTLRSGGSLDELLEVTPDEFYDFVAHHVSELRAEHEETLFRARVLVDSVRHLSRKEAAAAINAQHDVDRRLCFMILDNKAEQVERAWDVIRPELEVARYVARSTS